MRNRTIDSETLFSNNTATFACSAAYFNLCLGEYDMLTMLNINDHVLARGRCGVAFSKSRLFPTLDHEMPCNRHVMIPDVPGRVSNFVASESN